MRTTSKRAMVAIAGAAALTAPLALVAQATVVQPDAPRPAAWSRSGPSPPTASRAGTATAPASVSSRCWQTGDPLCEPLRRHDPESGRPDVLPRQLPQRVVLPDGRYQPRGRRRRYRRRRHERRGRLRGRRGHRRRRDGLRPHPHPGQGRRERHVPDHPPVRHRRVRRHRRGRHQLHRGHRHHSGGVRRRPAQPRGPLPDLGHLRHRHGRPPEGVHRRPGRPPRGQGQPLRDQPRARRAQGHHRHLPDHRHHHPVQRPGAARPHGRGRRPAGHVPHDGRRHQGHRGLRLLRARAGDPADRTRPRLQGHHPRGGRLHRHGGWQQPPGGSLLRALRHQARRRRHGRRRRHEDRRAERR